MFWINKLKQQIVELSYDVKSNRSLLYKVKIDLLLEKNWLNMETIYKSYDTWIFINKWKKNILYYSYDYDYDNDYFKLYKELKDKIEFINKLK